jgi:hypothetical protein
MKRRLTILLMIAALALGMVIAPAAANARGGPPPGKGLDNAL